MAILIDREKNNRNDKVNISLWGFEINYKDSETVNFFFCEF